MSCNYKLLIWSHKHVRIFQKISTTERFDTTLFCNNSIVNVIKYELLNKMSSKIHSFHGMSSHSFSYVSMTDEEPLWPVFCQAALFASFLVSVFPISVLWYRKSPRIFWLKSGLESFLIFVIVCYLLQQELSMDDFIANVLRLRSSALFWCLFLEVKM